MDFAGIQRQQNEIKKALDKRIASVLKHGRFVMGPEIEELESKLSDFCATKYCVSCSSGTDALLLSLMALGVSEGDAVFTTPFTFAATAEAIVLSGAVPVFVDVEPGTFNMDPEILEQTIKSISDGEKPTEKYPSGLTPRCIIPVDIFGLPADYGRINRIAGKYGLKVIADSAQSFGAEIKKKPSCSFADVSATSFFPAKPLGCYGDGGAVFTNAKYLYQRLVSLRVHGQDRSKYDSSRCGMNARMDTLQAGILLAKLPLLKGEIKRRNRIAERYNNEFSSMVRLQDIPDGYYSARAQYSFLIENRDSYQEHLKKAGIPSAVYYPIPLHLQTAFQYLGYTGGDMPVSEEISHRIISLPVHPYLTDDEIEKVIQETGVFFRNKGA